MNHPGHIAGAAPTATHNNALSSFTLPDGGDGKDTIGKDDLGRDGTEMDGSDTFGLSTFTGFGLSTFICDGIIDEIARVYSLILLSTMTQHVTKSLLFAR